MFLQRNQAGQVFVIPGALRAVADGSAVTSGTLTVLKDGVAAAAAGALTHVSGGAFKYQPTQGETDCKILGYVLEGTGAVPACGSVRTTAADPNDAVRLGLFALPDAVPAAAGGLPTVGAGDGQIQSVGGLVLADVVQWAGQSTVTDANDNPLVGTVAEIVLVDVTRINGSNDAADNLATAYSQPGVIVGNIDGNLFGKVLGSGLGVIAGTGVQAGLPAGERTAIAAALLDLANGVETNLTVRQTLRGLAAVILGDVTGAGTAGESYKAAGNNGTARVTPNSDGSGNRTNVTLNL